MSSKPAKKIADWPSFINANSEFILENTRLSAPPLTPEIKLHLCDEFTPMWNKTQEQLQAKNAPAPFWSFAWPGGQALARYVLDNPESVRGKSVFDFASGSGICAFAAKLAGAKKVVANDVDAMAIVAMGLNASANAIEIDVLHENKINKDLGDCEIILAGDFCYEWPMAGYAVEWMRAEIKKGRKVLFADPGRNYLPKEGLLKLAEYDVPALKEVEDCDTKHTIIYELLGVEEE